MARAAAGCPGRSGRRRRSALGAIRLDAVEPRGARTPTARPLDAFELAVEDEAQRFELHRRLDRRGDVAPREERRCEPRRDVGAAPDRARARRRASSRHGGSRGRLSRRRPAPRDGAVRTARRCGRPAPASAPFRRAPGRGRRPRSARSPRATTSRRYEVGYAPGATSASPRTTSRRSTPGRLTATRWPGSARSTSRSCTCALRTRTCAPRGSSRARRRAPIEPDQSVR